MIDPSKIKPQTRYSAMRGTVGRHGRVNQSLASIHEPSNLYKHVEIGRISKAGQRFSDRSKIGRNQAKIIGIDLYQTNSNPTILAGFQVTYEIKSAIKKGNLNLVVDESRTNKRILTLFEPDDFITNFECVVSDRGQIVGLSAMSARKASARAGAIEGTRRPLAIPPNAFPTCLYGSFRQQYLEYLGAQIIEDQ